MSATETRFFWSEKTSCPTIRVKFLRERSPPFAIQFIETFRSSNFPSRLIFYRGQKGKTRVATPAMLSRATFRVFSVNARPGRSRKWSPRGQTVDNADFGNVASFSRVSSPDDNRIWDSPHRLWARTSNVYRSRTISVRTRSRGIL